MAWVVIQPEAVAGWRFEKLRNLMGWDRKTTLGCLALLWFDSQNQDVVADTREEIKKFIDAKDDAEAEKIIDALVSSQWLRCAGEPVNGDGNIIGNGEPVLEIVGNRAHVVSNNLKRAAASKAGKASGLSRKNKDIERNDEAFTIQYNTNNLIKSNKIKSNSLPHDVPLNGTTTEELNKTPSTTLWKAYCEEYLAHHHEDAPPRNAKISSQLMNLVRWFGVEKAEMVVRHYFKVPNQYYVRNFHPVGLLVKDAHAIYGSMTTGKFMTQTQGRQMEEQETTKQQLDRIEKGELL